MTTSQSPKPPPPSKPFRLRGSSLQEFQRCSFDIDESLFEQPVPDFDSSRKFIEMAGERRLIIAIDYGTTFTGVAYATPNTPNAELKEIRIVQDWGLKMGNTDKVPSVISYSPATDEGEQQWGSSLSPNAVAMVNSKLELEVQDSKSDELDLLLQVLDGMNNLNFEHVKNSGAFPDYTWKRPEEIVTDYLTNVFQYVEKLISDFAIKMRTRLPVDIVLTVPVTWSYRAKDSTLRAVRNAGFNENTFPLLENVIMVTEPEAAAIYTARYLKEELGREFLKKGECFVLCDAGGGTVDVVSYKVAQLEPTLALEPLTLPTGAKCGSIYIDAEFKKWLLKLLGEKNYRKLAPKLAGQKISAHDTEERWMREIMKIFDTHKRSFCNDGKDMRMDFTEPSLANIDIPGKVTEGEFTITNEDMKSFFDPCVDRIVDLIEGQRNQVEGRGSRVKNIFLVGGLGESQYLQNELNTSMKRRGIQLRRPATSWSAVVRGAVIFGVEKATHKNLVITKACPRSYGICLNSSYSGAKHDKKDHFKDALTNHVMAKGQMTWLIKKGDLLSSDAPKEAEKEMAFNFKAGDKKLFKIPIYMYEDDDIPDRFHNAKEELTEVGALNCDFSKVHLDELDYCENPTSFFPYYSARCTCKATLSENVLTMEMLWNEDKLLCKIEINP